MINICGILLTTWWFFGVKQKPMPCPLALFLLMTYLHHNTHQPMNMNAIKDLFPLRVCLVVRHCHCLANPTHWCWWVGVGPVAELHMHTGWLVTWSWSFVFIKTKFQCHDNNIRYWKWQCQQIICIWNHSLYTRYYLWKTQIYHHQHQRYYYIFANMFRSAIQLILIQH